MSQRRLFHHGLVGKQYLLLTRFQIGLDESTLIMADGHVVTEKLPEIGIFLAQFGSFTTLHIIHKARTLSLPRTILSIYQLGSIRAQHNAKIRVTTDLLHLVIVQIQLQQPQPGIRTFGTIHNNRIPISNIEIIDHEIIRNFGRRLNLDRTARWWYQTTVELITRQNHRTRFKLTHAEQIANPEYPANKAMSSPDSINLSRCLRQKPVYFMYFDPRQADMDLRPFPHDAFHLHCSP